MLEEERRLRLRAEEEVLSLRSMLMQQQQQQPLGGAAGFSTPSLRSMPQPSPAAVHQGSELQQGRGRVSEQPGGGFARTATPLISNASRTPAAAKENSSQKAAGSQLQRGGAAGSAAAASAAIENVWVQSGGGHREALRPLQLQSPFIPAAVTATDAATMKGVAAAKQQPSVSVRQSLFVIGGAAAVSAAAPRQSPLLLPSAVTAAVSSAEAVTCATVKARLALAGPHGISPLILAQHFQCCPPTAGGPPPGGGGGGGHQALLLQQRQAALCGCLQQLVQELEVFRWGGTSGTTHEVHLADADTMFAVL